MKTRQFLIEHSGCVKRTIFAFPFLFACSCILVKITAKNFYLDLIKEDGFIETPQFLFYLAASILAFTAAIHFRKRFRRIHSALFLFLAFALLLIAMDEISWGERIFDLPLPKFLVENNVQKEITIHNLGFIQYRILIPMYLLAGFYGSFAWIALRGFRMKRPALTDWVVPAWYISSYFLPVFLIYLYFQLGVYAYWHRIHAFPIGGFIIWKDQEPAEFLLALGFLLFTVSARRRQELEETQTGASP